MRDTLLHAADAELFRPLWTGKILNEATFHLVSLGHMTQGQADELRAFLLAYFEGAWVDVSDESLAKAITKDPGDRHVLAAAIEEGAAVIVTENTRDFPPALLAEHSVTAQKADDFLLSLLSANTASLVGAVLQQQANYRNPPIPLPDLLCKLEGIVPRTVASVRVSSVRNF